jgi:HNH endonuclease
MQNLEVHHLGFRSCGGNDSEENLITLCAAEVPCFIEVVDTIRITEAILFSRDRYIEP